MSKKILKEKAEILDMVVVYLNTMCKGDMQVLAQDLPEKNLFLRFNIHGIAGFLGKYYREKELGTPKIINGNFLKAWNKHVKEVMEPLYAAQLANLKNEDDDDSKSNDFYS